MFSTFYLKQLHLPKAGHKNFQIMKMKFEGIRHFYCFKKLAHLETVGGI